MDTLKPNARAYKEEKKETNLFNLRSNDAMHFKTFPRLNNGNEQ